MKICWLISSTKAEYFSLKASETFVYRLRWSVPASKIVVQSCSKKWSTAPFPRSRASYFCLAWFIFVRTLLSENLAQATLTHEIAKTLLSINLELACNVQTLFSCSLWIHPGVANRTKPNQKSIEPNQLDCCSIGSVIEHNRTGPFRWARLIEIVSSITELDGRD